MKLLLEKWRKYEEEQRLDEFDNPISGEVDALRDIGTNVASAPKEFAKWSSYDQSADDTSGWTPQGAVRTAVETGVVEPFVKRFGQYTDAGNVAQHLVRGDWDEAGTTAAAGAGDAGGAAMARKLATSPAARAATNRLVGQRAGQVLGSFGGPLGMAAGAVLGDYAARKAAPAIGTAVDVYDRYGVGGTLSRAAEEAGEVVSDTAESFRTGDMFGAPGRAVANAPWNPLSRNFALYEGESMATHQKTDLLTESQIARMRELSGINSNRGPVLEEALTGGAIAFLVIYYIVLDELTMRGQHGRPEGGALSAIGRGVKSAWQKLKSSADFKAQQGDESLEAIVGAVESEGARAAQSANLSEEDIARIQSEFGDDEQLAALLSQLEEAPPEAYEQILMQVEQYVKSKL